MALMFNQYWGKVNTLRLQTRWQRFCRRHFQIHFLSCKICFCILVEMSLKFVPRGLINDKSKWDQIKAWEQAGNMSLAQPIMIQVSDAYMHPQDAVCFGNVSLWQDDVIKWKHFRCYWPFVLGIHRWIPLTKASDADLWCFLWSAPWINGRANNHGAGDLRLPRTHYDVTVMKMISWHENTFYIPCTMWNYKWILLIKGH